MAEIRIHREHQLGLAQARQVAAQWAEEVRDRFDMACSVLEGQASDTVAFSRTGVHGRLIVAGDHFDLEARLGFLLGAFAKTIEREITNNLDDLLRARAPAAAKRPAKSPSKKTAGKPPK